MEEQMVVLSNMAGYRLLLLVVWAKFAAGLNLAACIIAHHQSCDPSWTRPLFIAIKLAQGKASIKSRMNWLWGRVAFDAATYQWMRDSWLHRPDGAGVHHCWCWPGQGHDGWSGEKLWPRCGEPVNRLASPCAHPAITSPSILAFWFNHKCWRK